MRVLLADDDKLALAFLKDHLTAWGYSVTTARDGVKALKAVAEDPGIQVAILNWMMPGLDSWQVSRRLKEDEARDIYVIIIVGSCFCKEIKKAFPSLADEYISKPFDLQDVRDRLHDAHQVVGVVQADNRLPLLQKASGPREA